MDNHESRPDSTEHRVLSAACKVFALKGFHEATIAEICEAAGANIAAVNYYFRSKENLYVEAWRHAFARSVAAHPPDGGVPADAPPEERLCGRIQSIIQRISDPDCWELEIVHKEMANPTGLLTDTMHESIEPIQAAFELVVRDLLGPQATDEHVHLCVMSIRAQCFGPMLHERRRRMQPGDPPPPVPPRVEVSGDAYAEHVTRFSLAGIRELRRQIESDQPEDSELPQ